MSRPTVIASYTNGSFASISISVPNVLVGDWLVVCQSTMYSPSYAMAAPTGSGSGAYTEIGARAGTSNSSANADMRAWYKTCTSAGTHTVTVADDGTQSENMLVVLHMRGCAAIDGTPTQAEAAQTVNSASQSVPGVTTTTADTLLLGFWTGVQFTATLKYTKPASMTQEAQYAVNTFVAVLAASEALTSSGPTNARVATTSPVATHGWAAKLFAISGPQDSPPTVDAGPDAKVELGATLTRTATETGNGNAITSRGWEVVSGPTQIGPASSTAALSFTPAAVGTYVLRYSATNTFGTTADEFTLTVVAPAVYPPHVRGVSYATSRTTTVTVAKPAGTAEGDTLIAVVLNDFIAATGTGWTVTTAGGSSPADSALNIMRKTAGASEPANYSFGVGASTSTIAAIVAFKGAYVDAASWDVAPSVDTLAVATATTTPTAPSISPTSADPLLISVYGTRQATSGFAGHTPPPGMAELLDQSFTSPGRALFIAASPVPPGATDPETATALGAATDYLAQSMALVGLVPPVNLTDSGTGTDPLAIAADTGPLTDAGTGSEAIAVETLTLVGLADGGTGADTVVVDEFITKPLTDSGTGTEALAVERTTYVNLTDSATGTDALANRQDHSVVDSGTGTDALVGGLRTTALTDAGVGSEFIQIRDIPFTQVLPLRRGTLYELVVVARVPQASGPPSLIEVDPLEWKSLSYTNTLSQPQELEATCQISSIPESVLIRLRRLHEAATELWLYRNGQVVFSGPLQGWRTSGETLTLQAKGLLAYLRLMVLTSDLRFQQADQFTFVTTMIDQWQSQEYGHFGIDTSSAGLSGVLRDGTYLRAELHNVGQRVEELGKRENGFDAEVDPASRKLQLWFPGKGVDRSAGEDAIVIDARNITSGDVLCSVAIGDLASEAYGTGSSAGGDTTLWSEQANVDLRTHYGRSAVTGTWSDVSEQPTLDAHTRGLLDARGEALIVPGSNVRVTPDADLDDYAVGDTIAYALQSVLGVNGAFRIRRQHVAVSSTGQESVDLEFV